MSACRLALSVVTLICVSSCGCSETRSSKSKLPENANWNEILKQSEGQEVHMAMWDGDPLINAYMRDYVAPTLKKRHNIDLKLIGGQGNALVSKLMVDLETHRTLGDIDLMWINGETFFQLRQLRALYGPFTDRLPNSQFIDWRNRFIAFDFQQPVEGFECPWGNVQLTLIYHPERVPSPPKDLEELGTWIRSHPGRFTFDNGFTGMTFLKSLLYEFAGGPESLNGPFDAEKYQEASAKLWNFLRDLQPFLWQRGETFPEGVAQLHQLFMNNEVDFTMSNNDGEVDNKAIQGIIPLESRAYVLSLGTIRNSHYLGIPINAANKPAAMVLANFLISPEAQLQKALPEVWGDGTVLETELLPESWREQFASIPGRTRVPPRDELEQHALMEPAPEIMIRLHHDFREQIIEARR